MKIAVAVVLVVGLIVTGSLILHNNCGAVPIWNQPQDPEPEMSARTERRLKNPLMFRPTKESNPSASANSTLYVVSISSSQLWDDVPTLSQTVFKLFTRRRVYSDSGASIGKTQVEDVIAQLPTQELAESSDLNSYRIRRYGNDQNWGWGPEEYWAGDADRILVKIQEQAERKTWEDIERDTETDLEMIIFTDEATFFSPGAIQKHPPKKVLKIMGSEGAVNSSIVPLRNRDEETVIEARNISGTTISAKNWCEPLYALGGLSRWEIQSLYGREDTADTRASSHLYAAFYADFIMPYISTERENWEIFPDGPSFIGKTESGEQVTKSACIQLCKDDSECLAWEWRNNFECRLEVHGVRRGHAINTNHHTRSATDPNVITGWMIDRIREIRADASCDPLNKESGVFNDDPLEAEGWSKTMRDRLKLEGSDVLMALQEYEKELEAKGQS